jgi:hypothetical protein
MTQALTKLTGETPVSYKETLRDHYSDVRKRLGFGNAKPTNNVRAIIDEAQRKRRAFIEQRLMTLRRAREIRIEKMATEKWRDHVLTDVYTGERKYYSKLADEEARLILGMEARTKESRMDGFKWSLGCGYDFYDAIDIILERHAVTWKSLLRGQQRYTDVMYARGEIALLTKQFGFSSGEAARRMHIDGSTLRHFIREFGEKAVALEHFSRAVACVKNNSSINSLA